MREACGRAHLKAILGTGDLKTLRNVYAASMVAMQAGADFIKTSTGKEDVNATLPVSLVMIRALRDYRERAGVDIGFKPAGGLRTTKDALAWLILMKEELGLPWMQPDLFRIGASGLIDRHRAPARPLRDRALFGRPSPPDGVRETMGLIKDILRTMDYGPSPEGGEHVRAWLEEHASGFGRFINGAFAKPHDLFDVFNPATGERIALRDAGLCRRMSTPRSPRRGRRKPKWAALSGFERSKHLYALARHVQKRERFLSVLETIDNGKPIRESRDIDIPLVARHFYHHAGWASLIETEFPRTRPVGVCGQIIPWNFPLLMLAWKIAPALAAGNTVVLKPAEYTPLTALAFAAICVEAGLPQGVVNIVTGDGATGAALVAHAGVDKIAFTGSTEVGRAIRKATAGTGKKLSLELGGKSPFVVFEDADLDSAVEGVVDAIWFNQGQVCCAGSRLLVAESVAEALYAKLRARMANLRVGRSARQVDRRRRDRRAGSARADRAADGRRREGGARVLSRRRCAAAREAASIRRRWSPEWSPPRSSRARRSSVRCWSRRPSARPTRRSRSPTTPATASRLRSGPRTSIARSRSRRASRPASSGSIRPTCSTPPRASAAIAKAASAARAGARACPSIGSPTSQR